MVKTNKIIILNRSDLIKDRCNTPINEIKIYHFKSSSMDRTEMLKAHVIIFEDVDDVVVLKNRR